MSMFESHLQKDEHGKTNPLAGHSCSGRIQRVKGQNYKIQVVAFPKKFRHDKMSDVR